MGQRSQRNQEKESAWRKRLRVQAKSGLSVRAWCREQRLQESSFYWWRREIARRDEVASAFVPVHITPSSKPIHGTSVAESFGFDDVLMREAACGQPGNEAASGRIEIMLAGGRCVRVVGRVDRQALVDVLDALDTCRAENFDHHIAVQDHGNDRKAGQRC